VNLEKIQYILVSRCQKAGQRQSIKIANRSFEDVTKFTYLGTLSDKKCIHGDIKSRLNSGNAFYHSDQSLLSSRLLSRNVKIKIYKTIILPFVLYGCESWYLTLRGEHRLRVFENRVRRRIFGLRSNEVTIEWRKLHNEELHNLYLSLDIIRQIKLRRMRWVGLLACIGEETRVCKVLVGKPEGKGPLGRPRRRYGIRMDLGDSTGSG
jgi:hypothetical protein